MNKEDLFREGQKQFRNSNHDESIRYFTEYIDRGGGTEIAYLSRGVACLKLQKNNEAIKDFSRALDMNANNFRTYLYRGMAYLAIENYGAAILDFDKSISSCADNGAAYFARGTAYAQLGNSEEAEKNIKTALTCSESTTQGFSDYYQMFHTQFKRVLDLISGEGNEPFMYVSNKELGKVKEWLEDKTH